MYIVPEPIEVKAIEKYKLYIKFKNGEKKILDMGQDINEKFYAKLKDYKYFKNVKISDTGITIEWPMVKTLHQKIYIIIVKRLKAYKKSF